MYSLTDKINTFTVALSEINMQLLSIFAFNNTKFNSDIYKYVRLLHY